MSPTAVVLWMVAGMAWTFRDHTCPCNQRCPTDDLYSKENIIDNLLYEENRLSGLTLAERRSPDVLRGTVQLLADIRDYLTYYHEAPTVSCPSNFVNAGGNCLYLAKDNKMDWDKARIFCQQMGGDLAVFKDANEFAAALDYVKSYNFDPETRVWIGVEDKQYEGQYKWITGEAMKRATPFWGRIHFVKYGTHHDCGSLYGRDDYLIHDTICSSKHIPLCQIQ